MKNCHAETIDVISDAAGKLAAASLRLSKLTGLSTIASLVQIHIEAERMLMTLQSRKTGAPKDQAEKRAPGPTMGPKTQ